MLFRKYQVAGRKIPNVPIVGEQLPLPVSRIQAFGGSASRRSQASSCVIWAESPPTDEIHKLRAATEIFRLRGVDTANACDAGCRTQRVACRPLQRDRFHERHRDHGGNQDKGEPVRVGV